MQHLIKMGSSLCDFITYHYSMLSLLQKIIRTALHDLWIIPKEKRSKRNLNSNQKIKRVISKLHLILRVTLLKNFFHNNRAQSN